MSVSLTWTGPGGKSAGRMAIVRPDGRSFRASEGASTVRQPPVVAPTTHHPAMTIPR